MFLRCTERRKDGKTHYYYSVVENRRVAERRKRPGRTCSIVLTAHVRARRSSHFDSNGCWDPHPLRLEEIDAIEVKLGQMKLRRPLSVQCAGLPAAQGRR
ncbi:MAG: hypothetical protein AB1898_32315 [Acidobacteriota bacterium]